MDRHSEVEVKFRADKVSLEQYHKLMHGKDTGCQPEKYVVARGRDTYYRIHGSVLRYRDDGGGGVLTYKQRKSDDSIMDRIEIDLPLSEEVQSKDVYRVLKFLKAEEIFSI